MMHPYCFDTELRRVKKKKIHTSASKKNQLFSYRYRWNFCSFFHVILRLERFNTSGKKVAISIRRVFLK